MNTSSTGSALPMKPQAVSPQTVRKELAERIVKYVTACNIIMMSSNNASYKCRSRWVALDAALNLKALCNSGGSLKDLCRHTLKVKNSLYAILPLMANNSYENASMRLDGIISDCKIHLTPKIYVD